MPSPSRQNGLQVRKQHFVRSEIWNAAVDLFAEKGYDNTTVDEIAQAAGVSRRTIFRYFASKDDVMVQAMETYGDLLVDAVRESAGADQPLTIVERAVRHLAGFVVVQPRVRVMMGIMHDSRAARAAQQSEYAAMIDRVGAAFAEVVPSAGPHSPRLLASVTLMLLEETFRTWYAKPTDVGGIVDEVVAAFRGLTPVSGRPAEPPARRRSRHSPSSRRRSRMGS